jgi:hypothetical protein
MGRMHSSIPVLASPSLDSWDIAYLIARAEDGSVSGSAEIQLQKRSLCKTLVIELQPDEGAAIAELRLQSNAWIADWYRKPDSGSLDLGMWSNGWGEL